MRTRKELAQVIAPSAVRAAGAVRRMAISLTARVLWQLLGHKMPDGGQESFSAEQFSGIGFFARPPSNGRPEAIVLNIGDAKAPVIVATRDEKTRRAVAGSLEANESAMFNDAAIVHVKADGSIHARSKGGTAVALATKDDLDKLRDALSSAAIAVGAGGAAAVVAAMDTAIVSEGGTDPWPRGTSKLKGE